MRQTPIHEFHNPEVLELIPQTAARVIEIGCSSGALAREFRKGSPGIHWLGMEIDASYAELAARYCDETMVADVEKCSPEFYESQRATDCWIFSDVLEHLKDPWSVLRKIREVIPANGSIVACVPNAQHWTVIAKLALGDFRYEDMGLFDRTHLRWFTRMTLVELFEAQGFRVVEGTPRISQEPHPAVLQFVTELAKNFGADPVVTGNDIIASQYVVRAIPV